MHLRFAVVGDIPVATEKPGRESSNISLLGLAMLWDSAIFGGFHTYAIEMEEVSQKAAPISVTHVLSKLQ